MNKENKKKPKFTKEFIENHFKWLKELKKRDEELRRR